jgi:hypothetical protein
VGSFPFDATAGFTDSRLSPAADQLATLSGAVGESFEKGAELLSELAGIDLSASTIQRVTEATGERIAEKLAGHHSLGKADPWDWYLDALKRRVGYISLDATGVPQQGMGGKKVDGRMAYVGMIFNPLPDEERVFEGLPTKKGESMRARYVSGLYPLAEMGPLLRDQGAQVGLDSAEVWVALSDGGSGLEDFFRVNFPRAEVILDFYHASEYVSKLSKALHPTEELAATEQMRSWCRILKEEGGWVLLSLWESWDWPAWKGLKAVLAEVFGYFRNQAHRMDYPTYESQGWSIGSGAVESGCKTVVGRRLKGTGMRWSEGGSHALCHVRALYRGESSEWRGFWKLRCKGESKRNSTN